MCVFLRTPRKHKAATAYENVAPPLRSQGEMLAKGREHSQQTLQSAACIYRETQLLLLITNQDYPLSREKVVEAKKNRWKWHISLLSKF